MAGAIYRRIAMRLYIAPAVPCRTLVTARHDGGQFRGRDLRALVRQRDEGRPVGRVRDERFHKREDRTPDSKAE